MFHDHRDVAQRGADTIRDAFVREELALVVLDLSVYELVNIAVRGLRKTTEEAARIVDAVFDLGARLYQVDRTLARGAARIAGETGLSGYDAAFVGAGSVLAVPLVTTNREILERAGSYNVVNLATLGAPSTQPSRASTSAPSPTAPPPRWRLRVPGLRPPFRPRP